MGGSAKMGECEFMTASREDIPEIVDVYRCIIGTPGCAWNLDYPNRADAESDVECKSLYVLKQDGKIVAVASAGAFDELGHLRWAPKKPCEFARLGVVPALQKKGVGTLILQNVMQAAKKQGFDGMIMLVSKTNPAAMSLYEKNGFEQCGEAFEYGMDFYRYQIIFGPTP